jgi:hypothetical protein
MREAPKHRSTLWVKHLEYFSFGGLFIALIAVSLIRINATDTPWHLSTAQVALSEGEFLIRNKFSYTYSEHTIFQQYPIYQIILFMIYKAFGWEGLSFLHCAIWIGIYLLWLSWASPGRQQLKFLSLAWMVGLLGMQRRMILRPDMISILLLILLLIVFEFYRKGNKWAAAVLVAIQFLLVNSHQLFPLGIGFQIVFLVHLLIVRHFAGRYGVADTDTHLPLMPMLLALVGSIIVCFFSPLGNNIIKVVIHTISSLQHHAEHVSEFKAFYTDRYSLLLAIFCSALGFIGIYRKRRAWQPFEIGLWIIAAFVLSAAIRGIPLYAMICIGIFGRSFSGINLVEKCIEGKDQLGEVVFRAFCAALTLTIIGGILYARWVAPARILGGTQPGIGLAHGVWPHETIKFLKENPPPGEMINLSWYSGNFLIFDLFPQYRVFVDPRFESYPRDFLLKVIEAERSRQAFQELISRYQPDWMVLEIRIPHLNTLAAELIRENSWVLVHADTVLLTLVRNLAKNASYIANHKLNPENIVPKDFLNSEPDLRALQEIRMARLFADFGLHAQAQEMIRKAETVADRYVSVQTAMKEFKVGERN